MPLLGLGWPVCQVWPEQALQSVPLLLTRIGIQSFSMLADKCSRVGRPYAGHCNQFPARLHDGMIVT